MSSVENINNIIECLENNPELRKRLQDVLLRDYNVKGYPSLIELIYHTLNEIKVLRSDMNKRFEESDKRIKELIERMDKRFEEAKNERMELRASLGSIAGKTGIAYESLILKIMEKSLKMRDIDINKVEKFGIWDREKHLLKEPGKVTYDGYLHNGEHILVEIKFTAREADVFWFAARSKFFEEQTKTKTRKVLIAVQTTNSVINLCKNYGIEIVYQELLEQRYD